MGIKKGWLFILLYSATILVSEAVTIKIAGTYYENGNPAYPPEAFGITFDYDSHCAPEFVPAGTMVSNGGPGAVPLERDFYLYSLDGIKGFTAFAGAASSTSGTWFGLPSPTDGLRKIWFSSDLSSGGFVSCFFGGFSSSEMTISIGAFYENTGGYLGDTFIFNPSFGFSPGDFSICVTPDHAIPDTTATVGLLAVALVGAASLQRSLRMARGN